MRSRALLSIVFVLGCGTSGTTPPPDASPGDSSPGDGGCIQPVEGASCTQSENACQPPGDICCIGYSWVCQNGSWAKASVGCACQVGEGGSGTFACGPSQTCVSQEFCVDQAPGIAFPDGGTPPDTFSCNNLPAACITDHTCACVTAHNACPTAVSSCDDSTGDVIVHCMGQ